MSQPGIEFCYRGSHVQFFLFLICVDLSFDCRKGIICNYYFAIMSGLVIQNKLLRVTMLNFVK
jgi:hypothetical protein